MEIASDIRSRLALYMSQAQTHAPAARFVRPEGLHVTLKFLGEVACTERVIEALSDIDAGAFDLELRGTGFFPSQTRPRIFWVGLRSIPAQALACLAAAVDSSCVSVGFAPEPRPYQPHVTLARLGSGNPHARSGQTLPPASHFPSPHESFGMMRATEFHLYESKLHPKGAIYSKIHSFPLSS